MVSKTDVKFYKSQGVGLGGPISATEIVSATPDNLFDTVIQTETVSGSIEYRCFFVGNGHATETMEDCSIFLSSDNPNSSLSTVSWAIDNAYTDSRVKFPFLQLDGSNDYIDCTNDATLWSQSLTKFSFSFWIFPTAGWDGNGRRVVAHNSGSTAQAFSCLISDTTPNRIQFRIRNAANSAIDSVNDTLQLNQWNHVVCVYDNSLGSDNLKIYVNGVVGTNANLTEAINLSTALILADSTNDFAGFIKDFRWWTTKAISSSEVISLFGGEDIDAPNYWLKMDEGTGNPVDSISGSKVGTLQNGVSWTGSQTIANQTTAPAGITQWKGVSNGPISVTPNIGDIPKGVYIPVWVKWIITAGAKDAKNDFAIFKLRGKVPEGGTGGGGTVPPPTPSSFKFAIAGDWGCESMAATVAQLCVSQGVSLVCGCGDNNYGTGISCWLDRIKPIDDVQGSSIRFETAFGNHDNAESESSTNESQLKSHFGYGKTYHSFDVQNVHFLFLDNTSETSFTTGSDQHTFATNDLKSARENSNIDWIVVLFHKPMWGASSKHGYNSGNFNQSYGALFDTYKVDLMFGGHNHNMQITKQTTYNSSSPTSPTVTGSASPYTGGVGRIHGVSGAGGHDSGSKLYSVGSQPSFQQFQNDSDNGILLCELSNSNKTLTCKFVNIDGDILNTIVINR